MTIAARVGLMVCVLAVGCATTRPRATPESSSAKEVKALLKASVAEVHKGHFAEARALLDKARPLIGADRDLDLSAPGVALAIFTNQPDYEAAASALLDAIRRRKGDRADEHLFLFHNWMAIVREAQGDLAGAIVACASRT